MFTDNGIKINNHLEFVFKNNIIIIIIAKLKRKYTKINESLNHRLILFLDWITLVFQDA